MSSTPRNPTDTTARGDGGVVGSAVYAAAAVLLLFLSWEAAVRVFEPPPFVLPSPLACFRSISRLPQYYARHAAATVQAAALGASIGFLTGLTLGIVVHAGGRVGRLAHPLVVGLQSF